MEMNNGVIHPSSGQEQGGLQLNLKDNVDQGPGMIFKNWFDQAVNNKEVVEANAMNLSTVGGNGRPHSRFVLLKEYN